MATFSYSPQIRVRIATAKDTYDVSSDISGATITRRKGVSSFSLTLTNRGRKYDGVFSPMDRVTIYLKRVGPFLLVMSGYLDGVSAYSTYTSSIRLRGSCSLKRLQHWAWDPLVEHSQQLFSSLQLDSQDPSITDGGIAERITEILDKVMGWPPSQVHIGAVPDDWFASLGEIGESVIAEAEMAEMVSLAGNSVIGGTNDLKGLSTVEGIGPGTGTLPNQIVTVTQFGGEKGGVGNMTLTREPMSLADDARGKWGGAYYVSAAWPYRDPSGKAVEGADVAKATEWWANRAILLTNPKTGKGVVARAVHWGPGPASQAQVSAAVMQALGAKPGQGLHMAFAQPGAQYGAVSMVPTTPTPAGSVGGTATSSNPVSKAIQTVQSVAQSVTNNVNQAKAVSMPKHPSGYIVNTFAVLEDFLRWCVGQGIKVTEHPDYGGVTPGYHASPQEGGFHWWPEPNGGGAADLVVPAGGEEMYRKLDMAALEASKRNLGVIWRWANHWTHMHVAIQYSRDIGRLVYASDAELRALPPLKILDGTPGAPGGNPATGGGGGGGGGGAALDPAAMGEALFAVFERVQTWQTEQADRLGGKRALMNDVPLFSTIDELFKIGLRDWCSAPNGDIIGWFPDYFGKFGTAAKMIIEPVEVAGNGFEVEWSDDRLKTHMFVSGSHSNTGQLLENPGQHSASSYTQMEKTAGIASVEYPEMMRALFGITGDLFNDNAKGFLERFGARPNWEPINTIVGPRSEFFFSVFRFMKNWSQQYTARVNLTFMPELYPGMIAVFPHWGIQAYVEEVTHSVNMETGFTTQVNFSAWSKIEGHQAIIPGLPIGGGLSTP